MNAAPDDPYAATRPDSAGEPAITGHSPSQTTAPPHAITMPQNAPDDYVRWTLLVLLAACVCRIALIWWFPRGPDECMYWHWSCRLDLGYVDHPPMVAYSIALMNWLFGDTAWASRLLAIVLAASTGWILFRIGAILFDNRVGFWAATLHAACPMLSMGGGIMLLPESILQFWISLAILVSVKLVIESDVRRFYLLGLILGAALLTKYPAMLIPLALGLFAICSPPHRRWFRCWPPYAMCVIGLVMFVPVIVWNVQHNWASLTFLSRRTQSVGGIPGIRGVWESLTAQAAYHSPVTFVLLLIGVVNSGYKGLVRARTGHLLLFAFSGPVIIAFLVVSALRVTLPHWPAAGYLAAYVAAPAALFESIARLSAKSIRRRRRWLVAAASVGVVLCAGMPVVLMIPLTTLAYHKLQRIVKLPEKIIEPMAAAYGWDEEIRDRVLELKSEIAQRSASQPVVLTHFHLTAASLHNALKDACPVVCLGPHAYQYAIWDNQRDVMNRPVIYVSTENTDDYRGRPQDHFVFDQCTQQDDLPIVRRGVVINTAHFWLCEGFKGLVDQD